jgi:hypothetical protein
VLVLPNLLEPGEALEATLARSREQPDSTLQSGDKIDKSRSSSSRVRVQPTLCASDTCSRTWCSWLWSRRRARSICRARARRQHDGDSAASGRAEGVVKSFGSLDMTISDFVARAGSAVELTDFVDR